MAGNPLTTNLQPLSTGATAAGSLASLVMVIPLASNPSSTKGYQPLNPPSSTGQLSLRPLPDAILFNYEGEQVCEIRSDITDHYSESNVAIQDQIALHPEIFRTRGYIGELNNVLPALLQPLQTIANTLVTIDAYTPQLSVTALEKFNQAILLYENASSILNSAVGAWSSLISPFTGSTEVVGGSGVFETASIIQSKQQVMFQQFYGYWYSRTLFNIQTPWAIFTNMAIESMRAIQEEETRMISDFEVTFKKIRTASLQTSSGPLSLLSQGRAQTQSAPDTSLGTSAGAGDTSLGSSISGIA